MFNIIPLILILVSLVIIIFLIIKKFSVLANLDIDTIQAEREEKFKNKIVRMVRPILNSAGEMIKKKYNDLVEAKEEYNKKISGESERSGTEKLFLEFEELKKNGDSDAAEKKLIEIIGIDSKNLKAFRELGNLYLSRRDFNEAKQTFEHVIKLFEKEGGGAQDFVKLSDIYFDLASVSRAIESWDNVILNLDKALEIEPNNPRYLDTKLEISIIKKDKKQAQETYKKLAEVNPENQKLNELKKQIDELG